MKTYVYSITILTFGILGASIVLAICSTDIEDMHDTLVKTGIIFTRLIPYLINTQAFVNCSFNECCQFYINGNSLPYKTSSAKVGESYWTNDSAKGTFLH